MLISRLSPGQAVILAVQHDGLKIQEQSGQAHFISPAPHSLRGLTTLGAKCDLTWSNNFLTHLCA